MKRKLFIALIIATFVSACFAASVANYREQGGARWVIGGSLDVASGGDLDIESGGSLKIAGTAITATAAELNLISGDTSGFGSLWFEPTDTVPDANEGRVYYNESDETLKLRTSNAWVDVDVSGASSLGSAYAIGSAITVDTDAITLTSTTSADNVILALVHGETGNFSAMTISNASAYPALAITTTGDGADITGTSATWSVAKTGVATLVGASVGASDLTFTEPTTNDVYLLADGDAILTIGGTSKEDIDLNFATANTLTITSGTGTDKVNWGDVDAHSGLSALAFDAGAAGGISLAASGTYDLTIEQSTSGQDASLILQSSGTGTDALSLISSVADISLSSADNITRTAADNITDTTTDGGYTLAVGGATDGDLTVTIADVTSIVGVGAITIQNTEATSDITVNSAAGSVYIEAEEDIANAVLITADGGESSTMKLHNDTGTNAASIYLLSDVGGITQTASAGPIVINATGSSAGDYTATIGDDYTLDVTGTIDIDTQEGIDIDMGGSTAGQDFDVNTLASISLTTKEDATDAVNIDTQGGIDIDMGGGAADDFDVNTLSSINFTTKEDATNAVRISTQGGVDIDMGGGAADDFDVNTLASINFHTAEAVADQFKVDAKGAIDGDAINFETTNGGIMLNADGEAYGDIELNSADDMIITTGGDTTITTTGTLSFAGSAITNYARDVNATVMASYTLTAAESGGVFSVYGPSTAAAVTLTLPTAVAGYQYTIIDSNSNAGADVIIQAASGDTINGGTAAKAYGSHAADSYCSVTIVAMDATDWEIIAIFDPNECWVNDDS